MKKRLIILFFAVSLLAAMMTFSAYAAAENNNDIYCIARDGDCVSYPAYSLEAVKSACDMGADAVSVGVEKTCDGVLVTLRSDDLSYTFPGVSGKVSETDYETLKGYYLCGFDGEKTEYSVATLEQVLTADTTVIVDCADYLEQTAAEIKKLGAEDKVKLRIREDGKQAAQWSHDNGIDVIGIYYGNIIFSAVSHIKALSDVQGRWVQLQSGNFFSVLFNNYVMKTCRNNSVKPVCAMYDGELNGSRTDSTQGFDDIIGRGFSVIETNQPSLLIDYINKLEEQKIQLLSLNDKAKNALSAGEYSLASKGKLSQAIAYADDVSGRISSRLEVEKASAGLISAVKTLSPPDGKEAQKDSLNITTGKVIAVVIFGAVVVAAQVYVYKKKKK